VLSRFWRILRSPSKFSLGVLLLTGTLCGILLLGGFNYYISSTNTLEFCTSCHEMDTVFEEYKTTVHYKNASGVRAICTDCHVPHDSWTATVARKIKGTNELFHKIIGTISTKEKFEAHRLELAQNVWKEMEERDSRECRNCHSYATMDFNEQDRFAARAMQRGIEEGKTCIDCHKGIAHDLPKGYKEPKI